MIKQQGSRFRLYTADGSRPLGPWTTQEKAQAQDAAIKASQAGRHAERKEPMPRKLAGWARRKVRNARRATGKAISDAEVVATIQKEAKAAGATLQHDGKGGVDPRITLAVFRRDGWECSNENCPTPKKDLTLDHISGHAKEIEHDSEAKKRGDLKQGIKLGHIDNVAALHTLCAACHNEVHDRERALENGKKPPPMRG
jgi:hypothetical protein